MQDVRFKQREQKKRFCTISKMKNQCLQLSIIDKIKDSTNKKHWLRLSQCFFIWIDVVQALEQTKSKERFRAVNQGLELNI